MTSSPSNLSFPLCQMGIYDTLRSRLWNIHIREDFSSSRMLAWFLSPTASISRPKCSLQTIWCLPAETSSLVKTRHGGWRALWGGQADLVSLLPPHMCNFLRCTVYISFCSQPRCFWWKTFFFFLVTFALIFIRKPVCGLPLSITQLLLLEFKNVYRPRRPVCVSPLMNWAPN